MSQDHAFDKLLSSALVLACRTGNLEAAKELLSDGAKLRSHKESHHCPALMEAIQLKHAGIVQLLLNHGAKASDLSKSSKKKAIVIAATIHNPEVLELLLKSEIFGQNDIDSIFKSAFKKGIASNVKFLIEKKFVASSKSLMILAAKSNHVKLVKTLLDMKIGINTIDEDSRSSTYGMTPLMIACRRGDLKIARVFLQYGYDVKAKSRDGRDSREYARVSGNKKLQELLSMCGAKK
jgi:ankyrin repeat protein